MISRAAPAVAGLAFVGVALAAYAPYLGTGFGGSDSVPLIETSRFGSFQEVLLLFTKPVMAGTSFVSTEVMYRPFVSLTFGLDYRLWGLNAFGYHLTNLGLHVATTLSLWWLLSLLGLRWWSCLVGAAVFALHPLVLATVPVIARRDSLVPVLAFTFGLCLVLVAERGTGLRRVATTTGALLFIAVALLSKESAFAAVGMLPVVLLGAALADGCRSSMLALTRGKSPNRPPMLALTRATQPFSPLAVSANTPHQPPTGYAVLALTPLLRALPFFVVALTLFGVRLAVLGGFGGIRDGSNLLQLDFDRYAQIVGAYTRDLVWAFAGLAPSPAAIWQRIGAAGLAGLAITLVWLPRRHATLVGLGVLWLIAFGVFCAALKISTIVFVAYFALIGLALVAAAGLEGALVRLRSATASQWQRAASVLMLGGLGIAAVCWLATGAVFRYFDQWQFAGDVTQRYTQAIDVCAAASPSASRLRLIQLPDDLDDARPETQLLAVTLLRDYTIRSWLKLSMPERSFGVDVASTQTLRTSGASTLSVSCTQSTDGGTLSVSAS